jgi:hypothetical protein
MTCDRWQDNIEQGYRECKRVPDSQTSKRGMESNAANKISDGAIETAEQASRARCLKRMRALFLAGAL